MIRLVVDASCLGWPPSGTRRYLERLLEGLSADPAFEVVLVTNERVPVSSIRGSREVARRVKSGLLWRSTALVREARRAGADLLWLPWPMFPAVSPACPVVVTVHDISPLLHPGTKPWTTRVMMAVAGRRAVRRATRALCVSGTTADDVALRWQVSRSQLAVVPLAVDERFAPGDRQAAMSAVSERWGIQAPYLLAVGTIEPRKGYDLLPPLADLLPELPIVVVGRPGPRSHQILAALEESCRVVGGVSDDDLLLLYRGAELLLVPSLYEGFGLTAIEAMACGTPALVARGSGALEEMLEGTMPVVERDPTRWLEAVQAARADRSRLAQAARAFATRRTWADVVRETAEVMREVAARSL